MSKEIFMELSIDLIDEPEKELRSVISREGLDALIDSIRDRGVLQPLRVRENGERFEVICGHRRLLAARALGLATVPVVVAETSADSSAIEVVHENLIREDVNPIDLARWLQRVKREKGLTNEALSSLFGKSRGWSGHYLALLNCDGGIQAAVAAGQIDVISAQRLQSVVDPSTRHSLLTHAVKGGASQSVIAGWVAREKGNYVSETESGVGPGDLGPIEAEPSLMFECLFCYAEKPAENQVLIPLCSECYQAFKEAEKLEHKKIGEEVKE